jgi:glycosyltransferase involved in cell wall biosynthesis
VTTGVGGGLMRICVVGPTYPYRGGIVHYTTLLVRHLRAAGHSVRLYSFVRQYPRRLFPGETDMDPSSARLAVDCEYVLDPLVPTSWLRLARKVRDFEPDLLVLQWWVPYWMPSFATIARLVKRRTNIRVVYVCHNVLPHEGGGALTRLIAKAALRGGDGFVVHSEQDRSRLLALLPNAHVLRAHLPTYAELAELGVAGRRAPGGHEQEREPVLLFFGFIRPYKGLEYLIRALPRVLERLRVHLLVVGESWERPETYEDCARRLGVEQAVTFVDRYVPNEELPQYFEQADVVVLPYVSASQSAVVQLAFGFGKPVITTSVGGLPEVVRDGVNGIVVPPCDSEALAAAIIRFLDDRQLSERLAENAQLSAKAFSWEQLVSQIVAASRR